MDRLHRRDFLVVTGAAATAASAARASEKPETVVPAPAIASGARELRLATPWPDLIAGFGDSAARLARRIELASGGGFRVVALAGDDGRDALVSGEAELTHGFEAEEVERHPAFAYFAGLPGYSSLNAHDLEAWLKVGGGQDLWDDLAADFDRKPLLAGHTGPWPGLWSSIELRGLADLSGQGVLALGLARRVVAGLGGKPIDVAHVQYADALASGAAIAVECGGAQANAALGLAKGTRQIYGPGLAPAGGVLSLSVKRRLWEGLTQADQLLLAGCAAEEFRLTLAEARAHEALARFALRKRHGALECPLPDDILHAIGGVSDAVIAETAQVDAKARRTNASYMAFRGMANPTAALENGGPGGFV